MERSPIDQGLAIESRHLLAPKGYKFWGTIPDPYYLEIDFSQGSLKSRLNNQRSQEQLALLRQSHEVCLIHTTMDPLGTVSVYIKPIEETDQSARSQLVY